jgi:hypothetical protein
MALRRPEPLAGPGGPLRMPAGEWAGEYPSVWEFIGMEAWPSGERRKLGTIRLFVEDGAWKACLNDKEGSLVAFVTGKSPEGLFEAMEEGLAQGGLDWRRDRYAGGKGTQKRS